MKNNTTSPSLRILKSDNPASAATWEDPSCDRPKAPSHKIKGKPLIKIPRKLTKKLQINIKQKEILNFKHITPLMFQELMNIKRNNC